MNLLNPGAMCTECDYMPEEGQHTCSNPAVPGYLEAGSCAVRVELGRGRSLLRALLPC
jgi:D-arabinose 1-dehydrogenase-like Zn-dependent alcohol dehydrogenase